MAANGGADAPGLRPAQVGSEVRRGKNSRRVPIQLCVGVRDLLELASPWPDIFPNTIRALGAVRDALEEETRLQHRCKRRKGRRNAPLETWKRRCRRLQRQLVWSQTHRRAAEKAQKASERSREETCNAMSVPWMVRVALATPTTSTLEFSQTHADLVGIGQRGGCGRQTISRVWNAFAEVCKDKNALGLQKAVAAYCGAFAEKKPQAAQRARIAAPSARRLRPVAPPSPSSPLARPWKVRTGRVGRMPRSASHFGGRSWTRQTRPTLTRSWLAGRTALACTRSTSWMSLRTWWSSGTAARSGALHFSRFPSAT